jgi:hypothetical protein
MRNQEIKMRAIIMARIVAGCARSGAIQAVANLHMEFPEARAGASNTRCFQTD